MADEQSERTALHESIIEYQKMTFQAMQDAEMPELLGSDMTMPQFKILFLLYTHGSLQMSKIAEYVGKNISTATGVVDRLVEHNFIRREEDPQDRRVVKVVLTPAGNEFCHSMLQSGWRNSQSVLKRLTLEELRVAEEGTRLIAKAAMADAEERLAKRQARKPN